MSKKNKWANDPEARRLLVIAQRNAASADLLRATSRLAAIFRFESVGLTSGDHPILVARLTNGSVIIEFLYGPPEFHVEMLLSQRDRPDFRLGLAELARHPPVLKWLSVPPSNTEVGIGAEVSRFGELLLGPCAEVFTNPNSFFDRFRR